MDTNDQEKGKGYKLGITILSAVIVIATVIFVIYISSMKKDEKAIIAEKEMIQEQLTVTLADLGTLRTSNAEISDSLRMERQRADSLMSRMKNERNWNSSTVAKYKKELGTLRSIMQKYVEQIKELNEANAKLSQENIQYREEIKSTQQRAEKAEEQSKELSAKVKVGEMLSVANISMKPIRTNDKETIRMKRAQKLRIDFTLLANSIAKPGDRTLYARVIDPSGYPLSESQDRVFDFEGKVIPYTASRVVDYQNADINVSIYYPCSGLSEGAYTIEIYVDGGLAGRREIVTK